LEFEFKIILGIVFIFCVSLVAMNFSSISGMPIVADSSNRGSGMQPICTDSDGGMNVNTRGVVSVTDSRGRLSTFEDSCTGSNVLSEFICSNNQAVSRSYTCTASCNSGVCSPALTLIKRDVSSKLNVGVLRAAAQQSAEEQNRERVQNCVSVCAEKINECNRVCRIAYFMATEICPGRCFNEYTQCVSSCR